MDELNRMQMLRAKKFNGLCPLEFQETEIDKMPNRAAAEKVLAWKEGKRGLLLYGPTGRGKTRAVWLLLGKLALAGRCFVVMDSLAGFEFMSSFNSNSSYDWILRRCTCSLLFMDDVFKVKLTDAFEAAIFSIIEYRLSHQLPMIVTLNDTSATLMSRMTSDRGAALLRRLTEMSEAVEF
jgi:DNA replication protein DnaC